MVFSFCSENRLTTTVCDVNHIYDWYSTIVVETQKRKNSIFQKELRKKSPDPQDNMRHITQDNIRQDNIHKTISTRQYPTLILSVVIDLIAA